MGKKILVGKHGAVDQLRPHSYRWYVKSDDGTAIYEWLAHFMKNRDGSYHTLVKLPEQALRRSWLQVFFHDLDGDGNRENIAFQLDMSQYDWADTTSMIVQGPND